MTSNGYFTLNSVFSSSKFAYLVIWTSSWYLCWRHR